MSAFVGMTLTEAMTGRTKAVVVDGHNPIFAFYGDDRAVASAEDYVGTLPGHLTGRYGIDVSVFCEDCESYHSAEALCEDAS